MDKVMLSVPMYVNGEGINEIPGVLLALEFNEILAMVARISEIAARRQQDPDMFSMTRYRHGLVVFDLSEAADLFEDGTFGDGEGLVGETIVDLTPEQYTTIKAEVDKGNTLGFAGEKGAGLRVECCQEHYMDDGVYFTAKVKHTSIELESSCLSLDVLRGYLDRGA